MAAASPPLIKKSTGPSIFTYAEIADAVKRVNKTLASSDLPSLDGSVNSIKSVGSPHSSSDSHVFSRLYKMSFRTQKTKLKPETGQQDINIAKPAVKKQDNELLKQKVKQNLFREKPYCQKKG